MTSGLYQGRQKNAGTSGIQIDTSRIQVLESDFYKSYTFQVVQDSIEKQQMLKNYVLTVFNDSTHYQWLVAYPVIGTRDYDIDNAIVTDFTGGALLYDNYQKTFNLGTPVTSWDSNINCVDFPCSQPTGNGHHYPGDSCTANSDDRAYTQCYGGWVTTVVPPTPINEIDAGSSSGGGGTNSAGQDDEQNEPPQDLEIGVTPNDGANALDDQDEGCPDVGAKNNDSTYKAKIQELKTNTGDTRESGYRENLDGSFLPLPPVGQFSVDINVDSNMKGSTHVHMRNVTIPGTDLINETYKIFSPKDFNKFLKLLKKTAEANRPLDGVYFTLITEDQKLGSITEGSGIKDVFMLKYKGDIASIPVEDYTDRLDEYRKKVKKN